MNHFPSAVLLCAILLTGCASRPQTAAPSNDKSRARNEGYSLLYSLAEKDSDVGKLFIVKHPRPQIVAEIKQIAKLFQEAKQRLDTFKNNDPALNFNTPDLPAIEQKTRDAIEKTYTKVLLFSTGKTLEVELLQSQIRSLDYAAHLAKTIATEEDSKTRKDYLTQFFQQCDHHHKVIIDLLASL